MLVMDARGLTSCGVRQPVLAWRIDALVWRVSGQC